VGATDYCSHPPTLDVSRVGGSKYPRLEDVLDLRPDLVLMNEEENRREDADALERAGIEVFVTFPRTVDEAFVELRRLVEKLGGNAAWLDDAEQAWAPRRATTTTPVVVPVWRRPWVVLGPDTFAADVLRRLGFAVPDADERYPRPPLTQLQDAPLVVFPDEPYAFSPQDGPDAFPHSAWRFVSGRYLTWYGPSLRDAPGLLSDSLRP
jgi:ABC-type Fe3+-hydroxamate transport system substrate-binding protein